MAFVGEAVLAAFIETLCVKLASSDLLRFARQEEIFADLKKWEKTLLKLHAVLVDAEEKQLTSRLVKMWLDDLRDLSYDVEDILDDFATEALGRKFMAELTQPSSSKVRRLIPSCCTSFTPTAIKFNVKMRSKIDDITSRLKDISAEKNDLHLSDNLAVRTPTTTRSAIIPDTTCSVDESRVCGRETDKAAILKLLFDEYHEPIINSDDSVPVIAIIGMGGLGKTTLAQLAYNHDKAKSHFDLRVWVCVSDDFDVLRVTRTILQYSVPSDVKDLNQLQLKLKEQLSRKKFLLVLDDVWNENRRVWEIFYHPIMRSGGAQGSRVIVTTRNQGVISAIGATSTYPLKGLSYNECLSLFAQQALGKRNFDDYPELRVVGGKIAEKCKGLPLAAKTLGGMLRTNQNLDAWQDILESKIWNLPDQENNDILPALQLSYFHLPSPLKRCFAYCSIFPKDYVFKVDELVLLWMGEGFLHQVKRKKRMGEIGLEFFHELLARSFFQHSDSISSQFVMHDLVHDLARFVAGETCFNLDDKLENSEQHAISERARHSSFIRQEYVVAGKFEAFVEVKTNLRTLISLPTNIRASWEKGYISQKVLNDLLTGMRCLRVLSLAGYYTREVPDLISELKHLRYLNFSHCSIERLPDSVGDLYNLQTLILHDCDELIKLPKGIGKLINLQHLDITGTRKLQEMSFQVDNLTNLQTLSRFIVSKSGGPGIGELKNLSDLQGVLSISKLHEIAKVEDAGDANLKNKRKLEELIMEWNDEFWDSRNDADELQVLESLRPHENLERLTVAFYGGSKFPCWIGDPSFSKMVNLTLRDCKKCTSLPTLGGLPLLEVLHIECMGKVESIGDEFYGECKNPFASLKKLQLVDMPEWESWSHSNLMKENIRAFHKLEKFVIRKCPKLVCGLPGMGHKRYLVGLQELVISDCGGLTCLWEEEGQEVLCNLKILRISNCAELEKLPSVMHLENLEIERCPKLESFPETGLPPMLSRLTVKNCGNLKGLPQNYKLCALKSLMIFACPSLRCFPNGELPTTLEQLSIRRCDNLESLPEGMGMMRHNSNSNSTCSLEYLDISDCPSLKSFSTATGEFVLPSTLKKLTICSCFNLESMSENMCPNNTALEYLLLRGYPNLRTLPECLNSLKELRIDDCIGLECFPSRGLSTSNLTVLHIYNCQNLEYMSSEMRNLKSLEKLCIIHCPRVKSFPEGDLPPNLTSLEVRWCENLKTPISEWGLQSLTSLSELTIHSMFRDMVSFPDDKCLLPSSLTTLTISGMRSLTSLPLPKLHSLTSLQVSYMKSLASLPLPKLDSLTSLQVNEMESLASLPLPKLDSLTSLQVSEMESLASLPLQNLTSLQSLRISSCPKLRSLGLLPSTLENLEIFDCPIIKKRCLKGKGQYFPNIAYIPFIRIEDKDVFMDLSRMSEM